MTLKLCLVIDGKWLTVYFGSDWWCFFGVSKKNAITIIFNMLLNDGKSFFRSQKDHKLIYLWGSIALKLCLVVDGKWLKNLGVTDDVSFVFSRKLFLQWSLIWYWMMENHFTEVKKTTNSFTYEVQWHWNYVWL